MKNMTVHMAVLVCLFLVCTPPSAYCQKERNSRADNLRMDIQIINLLNNLELTVDQARFVIACASRIKELRGDLEAKESFFETDLTKSLAAVKDQVQAGRVVIEQKDAGRFHHIKASLAGAVHEVRARAEEMASEVEALLKPYQLAALDGYKPCVIPIVSEGRIGQADSSHGVCRLLEDAQRMTEEQYEKKKEDLVRRAIKRLKLGRHVTEKEEASLQDNILEAFREARAMESADFEINKSSLADKLSAEFLPAGPVLSRQDKIKKFLFSENVIAILEERLNRSRTN